MVQGLVQFSLLILDVQEQKLLFWIAVTQQFPLGHAAHMIVMLELDVKVDYTYKSILSPTCKSHIQI